MNEHRHRSTLLIIPAFNEEKNLPELFAQLASHQIDIFADILIVNDGSRDRTEHLLRRYGVRTLCFPHNLGYGNALKAGYQYAVRHDYSYVIQMDSDGQHDPSNIPLIYDALVQGEERGVDIVLGSRFLPGSAPYQMGFFRRMGIGLHRLLILLLAGERIADPTTGLQGLSRRAFYYYARSDHYDPHYPDADILIHMLLLGFRIEQIPAVMHARSAGTSMHAGIVKPIAYMLRSTLSILAGWLSIKLDGPRVEAFLEPPEQAEKELAAPLA